MEIYHGRIKSTTFEPTFPLIYLETMQNF